MSRYKEKVRNGLCGHLGKGILDTSAQSPDKGACLVVARDIEDVNVARADEEKREE